MNNGNKPFGILVPKGLILSSYIILQALKLSAGGVKAESRILASC